MSDVQQFTNEVIENVERVIVGKRDVLELIMAAVFCQGHVLLEDVPGTGKTMVARSLATSLGLTFKRLQCTPDLLPNDVTGVSIFDQGKQAFEFIAGPVFTNILLADEINRATPRTQSALLEAMGEGQVTVDGQTRPLLRPYFVLATQNPVEYEGTFPLPEAQLDRFLMKLSLGYLEESAEKQMLLNLRAKHPIETLKPIVNGQDLLVLSEAIWDVHIDQTVLDYIVNLVFATRKHPDLLLGASPRGSLALYRTSQALAAIRGRDFVLPDDVKYLAVPVLSHRCLVDPESALRGMTAAEVITALLDEVVLEIAEPE